jgi:hypothetical protein
MCSSSLVCVDAFGFCSHCLLGDLQSVSVGLICDEISEALRTGSSAHALSLVSYGVAVAALPAGSYRELCCLLRSAGIVVTG